MERTRIVKTLASLRPALQAEGVRHVALFGSRARGDHGPDSDVDLLIDVDPDSRFSILNLVGVEHIVGDATGLRANALMRRSLDGDFQEAASVDLIEIF